MELIERKKYLETVNFYLKYRMGRMCSCKFIILTIMPSLKEEWIATVNMIVIKISIQYHKMKRKPWNNISKNYYVQMFHWFII